MVLRQAHHHRRRMGKRSSNMNCIVGVLVLCTIAFQPAHIGVSGLKDMHIKVPEAVRVGDTVTLACDYDLEQVALYTIKWYHHGVEFYRYVPKESPPSLVFNLPSIEVDIYRSNSREVTLRNVHRETSGMFKCEVSADAPLFHTEIRAAHLLVAEVPEDNPVLRTEVHKIAPGANIRANCTTPGSFPPMNITWYINDSKDLPKFVHIEESINRYDALPGLESVRSTIYMRAAQDLFKNGKMKLKCTATMFHLYSKDTQTELIEEAPLMALVMVSTTPSNDGVNTFKFSSATKIRLYLCNYILIYMVFKVISR
ncbi:uncharacterized protein [Atheta coriaria]|uniref:uncharacterized protein n=1 Tax=Dalotia coriaria TaxID=877792 RepID=UPI0031F3508F